MRIFKLSSLLSLLVLSVSFAFADVAEGEKLFNANCTSCHAINDKVVGPALKDVDKRHNEAWLIKWIKNSQAMVKAGDAEAVKVFNENGGSIMTPFETLKDSEIKSILEYIKTGGPKKETPTTPTGVAVAQSGFYNTTTLVALTVMALILLLIVFVLYRIKKTVRELYNQKFAEEVAIEAEEKAIAYKHSWKYKLFKKHPVVGTSFVLMAFMLVLGLIGFDYGNKVVGVQKGYMPTQPINYSHELHAGKYKINCQYCHSGADKSKQATIPSPSTCMNCHSHVTAKDKYNGEISPEIKKIYAAVDWNPETKTYGPNQKPIKWVRIHNLPDHAYFNHAQHVKIGKVECQACHGPVETMKVVSQQRSLQMGWCINCHREAKVDVANNDYYEELHKGMKKDGKP
jgi:mono/diheme cytochrome c family protein